MNKIRQSKKTQTVALAALMLVLSFLLIGPETAFTQSGWVAAVGKITYTEPSGKVGIGTTTPDVDLLVKKTSGISEVSIRTDDTNQFASFSLRASGTDDQQAFAAAASGTGWNTALDLNSAAFFYSASSIDKMLFATTKATSSIRFLTAGLQPSNEKMRITAGGTVGIATTSPDSSVKLHVNGAVRVDGNIAAKYQDVAEWVPTTKDIRPGTVVILDQSQNNHVIASSGSYDTRVAGVVSANPGVILGEAGEGKVMVATTGRVKVRVDASRGPIRVGDLLVTSDKEGIAMKSEPLKLGGIAMHRPGTLIGKALEPLDKGVREILVLLSMQ